MSIVFHKNVIQTRAVTRQRARLSEVLVVKKKTGLLGASKSKKGDNSVKILDRVMGLGGMIMSINPEDMCEV